jgi:hypothetical protein
MATYSFITRWHFEAAAEDVWRALDAPERYGEWWPAIVEYRDLAPGVHGVGSRAERVVKGFLPYSLRYTTAITQYDPPREVAYDSVGDLTGRGRFVVEGGGDNTQVTFYWDVSTRGFWLNLLAPLLKPLFAWNHHWVMAQGERGLAAWLKRQAAAA